MVMVLVLLCTAFDMAWCDGCGWWSCGLCCCWCVMLFMVSLLVSPLGFWVYGDDEYSVV